MSDQVTVSATTDEIRKLIQSEQHGTAIALCQHILRYFPKHIETYRQMAEATLEKGDLEGARELFGRVLSADPENTVAYAGLAIVFEQQHLTDEAFWHLERAHELAPANLEIRQELVRLSAELEGKSRTRLKITPGGLARLYEAEGLFTQAAQEFRTIAGNSPKRFDARAALAEVLWRSGRVSEAADTAQSLLRVLPFCLKANLILGMALQQSGVEESENHLQLAEALDPTNRVARDLFGAQSPLKPNDPVLPLYVEEASPAPAPGLTFATEEEMPFGAEWQGETPPAEPATESPAPELNEQTLLPDWLVQARTSGPAAPTELTIREAEQEAPGQDLSRAEEAASAEALPFAEQPPAGEAPAAAGVPLAENPLAGELPAAEETPAGEAPPAEKAPFAAEAIAGALPLAEETLPFAENEPQAQEPVSVQIPKREEGLADWLAPEEQAAEQTPAEAPSAPLAELPPEVETPSSEATAPSQASLEIEPSGSIPEETKPSEPTLGQEAATPPKAEPPSSALPPRLRADFRSTTRPAQSTPRVPPKPTAAVPSSLPPWLTELPHTLDKSQKAEEESRTESSEPLPPGGSDRLTEDTGGENQAITSAESFSPSAEEQPAEQTHSGTEVLSDEVTAPPWAAPDLARTEAQEPLSETPSGLTETLPKEETPAADVDTSPVEVGAPAAETGVAEDESAVPVPPDLTGPEKMPPPSLRRRQVVQANARLEQARAYAASDQIGRALDEYEQIVAQTPVLISQVIPDLEKLVTDPGTPLKAHRVLGDAYTRVERLAEALEQYRFVLDRVS